MKRVILIYNASSGKDSSKVVAKVEAFAKQANWTLSLLKVGRGHGDTEAKFAALAKDGADIVIAAGGDGTLHHTARMLMNTEYPMAILPLGTGNGIARHYGIPLKIEKALEYIEGATAQPVDMGLADGIPFMGFMGAGIDSVVAYQFEKHPGKRSFLRYFKLTVKSQLAFRPVAATITIENSPEVRVEKPLLLNAAVVRQFGSGAQMAPLANSSDGLLELCCLRKPPLLLAPFQGIRLFNGSLYKSSFYNRWAIEEAAVYFDNPVRIQLDGEPQSEARQSVHVKSLPSVLQLLLQ